MRAAILTSSTSKPHRKGNDLSGARLVEFARQVGGDVVATIILPDEREMIEQQLRDWADQAIDLVLTTGGTGFAPNDIAPEATNAVIEREAHGLVEAMRLASREHTRHWMLSRAVAGIRGQSLITNFPGNPISIEQAGAAIVDALPHALELLAGRKSHPRHRPQRRIPPA